MRELNDNIDHKMVITWISFADEVKYIACIKDWRNAWLMHVFKLIQNGHLENTTLKIFQVFWKNQWQKLWEKLIFG